MTAEGQLGIGRSVAVEDGPAPEAPKLRAAEVWVVAVLRDRDLIERERPYSALALPAITEAATTALVQAGRPILPMNTGTPAYLQDLKCPAVTPSVSA
jgi:hypothetical protein